MLDNFLLKTDGYKYSHFTQYPPGTTKILSYLSSRGGEFPSTLWFGLQMVLKKHFLKPITMEDVYEAQELLDDYTGENGYNIEGFKHIVEDHNGLLPLLIKAAPEGLVIPTGNVMLTIENTCPKCFWLTNFVETLISQLWYPTTVATISYHTKLLLTQYLTLTGTPSLIPYMLNDFGYRGSTSDESAGIGGVAHLLNFKGSDTTIGLVYAKKFYGAPRGTAGTIPAAEHSTITSWGRAREAAAYKNILKSFPSGPVAVVSDSYDIFNACKNIWGNELLVDVMGRDGQLVIRPDSGDPLEVTLKCLHLLGETFGTYVNSKGYKVLNDKVRVIWGDGINYRKINVMLAGIVGHGWSVDNIRLGEGTGLLQDCNRDTQKFAVKCSLATINGVDVEVYKDPITDSGKKSFRGRQVLYYKGDGRYITAQADPHIIYPDDILRPVFRDGVLLVDDTFKMIQERAIKHG